MTEERAESTEKVSEVVRGSREDILEQIYLYLETGAERTGKEQQLNCLQEIMIQLTKIAKDDKRLYDDWFLERWYHGK